MKHERDLTWLFIVFIAILGVCYCVELLVGCTSTSVDFPPTDTATDTAETEELCQDLDVPGPLRSSGSRNIPHIDSDDRRAIPDPLEQVVEPTKEVRR